MSTYYISKNSSTNHTHHPCMQSEKYARRNMQRSKGNSVSIRLLHAALGFTSEGKKIEDLGVNQPPCLPPGAMRGTVSHANHTQALHTVLTCVTAL